MSQIQSESQSFLGTQIEDRYLIEAEIGRGGMGIVYKAQDLVEKQPVAVKTMIPSVSLIERTIRFKREFRAISRLQHPNIVQVIGSGMHKGHYYYAMEYLKGKSLKQFFEYIPQQPFDFTSLVKTSQLITVLYQLCDALQYIHLNRIFHRDLKPDNILVTTENNNLQLKLLDFGLVHDFDIPENLTQEGMPLGTVAYMSPEQALGSNVDHRTDLYSLGVILYELMTGRLPFAGRSPFAIIMEQSKTLPDPPGAFSPGIPDELNTIIMKLLEKEVSKRYQSTLALWHDLEAVFKDFKMPESTKTLQTKFIFGEKFPIFMPQLIKRDPELQTLLELFPKKDEMGKMMILQGELGSGKSRLVNEIKIQARIQKANVFIGFSVAKGNFPLGPIFDILNGIVSYLQSKELANIDEKKKNLLTKINDFKNDYLAQSAAIDKLENQMLKHDELEKQISSILNDLIYWGPFILVFEDFHWASSSTWQLVKSLIAGSARNRYSVLITMRPEDFLANPISEDFNQATAGNKKIVLDLLDFDDVVRFISSMLGQDLSNQPKLIKRIFNQTKGNPFFTQELIKVLIDSGSLFYQEKNWLLKPVSESKISFPDSVTSVLKQRVQALSDDDRSLLEFSAILGQKFTFNELLELTGWPDVRLLDALDDLIKASLFVETSVGGTYEFTHQFIQNAIYQDISPTWKMETHTYIAELIERNSSLSSENPIYNLNAPLNIIGKLFYHFNEAKKYHPAFYYGLAVTRVCYNTEMINDFNDYFTLLNEIYLNLESAELNIEWKFYYCFFEAQYAANNKNIQLCKEKTIESIQLANQTGIADHIYYAQVSLIRIHIDNGKYDDALEVAQSLTQHVDKNSFKFFLGHYYNTVGFLFSAIGNYSKSIESFLKSGEYFKEYNKTEQTLMQYQNLSNEYEKLNDIPNAKKYLLEIYPMLDIIKQPQMRATILFNIGRFNGQEGNLQAALDFFTKSKDIFESQSMHFGTIFVSNIIGQLFAEMGQIKKAFEIHQELVSSLKNINQPMLKILSHRHLMFDLLNLSRYSELAEQLLYCNDLVDNFKYTDQHLKVLLYEIDFSVQIGKFKTAKELLDSIPMTFNSEVLGQYLIEYYYLQAKIELLNDKKEKAFELLEKSIEVANKSLDFLYRHEIMAIYAAMKITSGFKDQYSDQLETSINELMAHQCYLRVIRVLDIIISDNAMVHELGPATVKTMIWNLQEEIDISEFQDFNWKITFFESFYVNQTLEEKMINLNDAFRMVRQIANAIDNSDDRQSYLNLPIIKIMILTLFRFKEYASHTIDFDRILIYLRKNKAFYPELGTIGH